MSFDSLHLRLRDVVRTVIRRSALASPIVLATACACPQPEVRGQQVTEEEAQAILDQGNSIEACASVCADPATIDGDSEPLLGCQVEIDGQGGGKVDCYYVAEPNCAAGRRPPGLVEPPIDSSSPGGWLARVAHLEAASVSAFERLAQELQELGAPAALTEQAQRAAADEVRHAEQMAALARRHGHEPPTLTVEPRPLRGLEELALDNAVEGCVRESYAAMEMLWLSECGADDELRELAAEIGADESRHAALSYRLHAWLMGELEDEARQRVEARRSAALNELRAAMEAMPLRPERAALGLPSGPQASAMLAELAQLAA